MSFIFYLKIITQVFWECHQKNLIVKIPGTNLFSRLRNTCLKCDSGVKEMFAHVR